MVTACKIMGTVTHPEILFSSSQLNLYLCVRTCPRVCGVLHHQDTALLPQPLGSLLPPLVALPASLLTPGNYLSSITVTLS